MLPEIRKYSQELKKVLDNFPENDFGLFLGLLLVAYRKNRQIFIFGNGGSAASAMHFTCDINKGVSAGLKNSFRVHCLNDNISSLTAYANDISYESVFMEQLKNFFQADDLAIGISASGNSRNVVNAIKYANRKGGITLGLSGFHGGRLIKAAKYNLVVRSNDMQVIEDMHLVVLHMLMRSLECALVKNEARK